ncbi:MAG: penicillin acylase family protein, partial [Chitinophagales bacterium]
MKKLLSLLFSFLFIFQLSAQRNYAEHVTIVRDKFGVPHIFGEKDVDVAYGLAWANAEDDFNTMQETIAAAKGLQARILGKDGANMDYLVHAFRSREVVEEQYDKQLTPEYRAYIEAYAKGANDYADANPKEILHKKIFPITAQDILVGSHLITGLISYAHVPIQKIMKGKYDDEKIKFGSNAFAFAPDKTESGNPILCANPHLPFEGFISWYEAHLQSEEGLDVYGATFPGASSIFVGTNQYLGWTHTFNKLDLVDVYKLKMHPDEKLKYEYDGEWLELEERKVKLKVKVSFLRIPVGKKTYWSKLGFVIQSKQGDFYAIRWASNMDINASQQWYYMNKATNFDEFYETFDMLAIPRFNTVYADREGNILYINYGKLPKRDSARDWTKVQPGHTSDLVWDEFYTIEELPQIKNPDCGYVFNTNNTPYNATCEEKDMPFKCFPSHMGFKSTNNNRSLRFMELIDLYDKVSYEDVKDIKFDNKYPESGVFLDSLNIISEIDAAKYPELEKYIKKMQAWNKEAKPYSIAATYFLLTLDYVFQKKNYTDKIFYQGLEMNEALFIEALGASIDHLEKHFKSDEVPLRDIHVLRRGDKEVFLPGFPDVLAANYTKKAKDGKYVAYVGDSYTLIVEYGPKGPVRMESQVAYGASAKPESPHYTDQMDLFSKQITKKVTMNKKQIFENARAVYKPGE